MGTVGLFDVDMDKYIHVPFNLELMKLSSYYKKKREIVSFAPEIDFDKYSKFILRKDFNDGDFPNLTKGTNVEYGGHAFTGERYKPLPMEIETLKPDIYIYEKFREQFSTNKKYTTIFQTMMGADHIRLSLDGKTIWEDFLKPTLNRDTIFTYFFHDYDLNSIKDADLVVKDLLKRKKGLPAAVGTKFPIQINKEEDLFKWLGFHLSDNNFSIRFNGVMSNEALVEFVEKQKSTSMARQIDYMVTVSSSGEDDFIERVLPIIYDQAIFCRINRIPLALKYEDDFFVDKRWEKVLDLISIFIRNMTFKKTTNEAVIERAINFESLYSFVYCFTEEKSFPVYPFTRQEARELFQLVREKNYSVFKDFYEKSKVKLEGGRFINESTRFTIGNR